MLATSSRPRLSTMQVRLYLRFMLRYREAEELLAERGIDISYETIRR
jgi:putative transposase